MHGFGFGWGWGMLLLGGLLMLLFWGVVIALAVWAVRALSRSDHNRGGARPVTGEEVGREGTALEVLKQRYARGEISREEYLAIRRDLET